MSVVNSETTGPWLCVQLSDLLSDQKFSDVRVIAGKGPSQRSFELHRIVLDSHSNFFHARFEAKKQSQNCGKLIVRIHDIPAPTFEDAVKWMYKREGPGTDTGLARLMIAYKSSLKLEMEEYKAALLETMITRDYRLHRISSHKRKREDESAKGKESPPTEACRLLSREELESCIHWIDDVYPDDEGFWKDEEAFRAICWSMLSAAAVNNVFLMVRDMKVKWRLHSHIEKHLEGCILHKEVKAEQGVLEN
ncbi:hypothetical protein ABW19_dt0205077 [Dactylella cylindrospora]|nr:hypothetical protein ABW19_dt0205077 [Dactylella cylindrospora]